MVLGERLQVNLSLPEHSSPSKHSLETCAFPKHSSPSQHALFRSIRQRHAAGRETPHTTTMLSPLIHGT